MIALCVSTGGVSWQRSAPEIEEHAGLDSGQRRRALRVLDQRDLAKPVACTSNTATQQHSNTATQRMCVGKQQSSEHSARVPFVSVLRCTPPFGPLADTLILRNQTSGQQIDGSGKAKTADLPLTMI